MNVVISGSGGFVGTNFMSYYSGYYTFHVIKREHENPRLPNEIFWSEINKDVLKYPIIHLAGKSQDVSDVNCENEYYAVNTELTKRLFEIFLESDSKVFIFLSSVKAVTDSFSKKITEDVLPSPKSIYGKSKLLAEQYIFSKPIPKGKRVYVLRPCIIHGPGNKGNLNLFFKLAGKQLFWPLAAFENKRSFCTIDNLCFVINELLEREDVPSGIYNVSDDEPVSTSQLFQWMADAQGKKPVFLSLSKLFIISLAKIGDKFRLPFNTEILQKLTENNQVCNKKIKSVLGKPLPLTTKEGFMKTFHSFNQV